MVKLQIKAHHDIYALALKYYESVIDEISIFAGKYNKVLLVDGSNLVLNKHVQYLSLLCAPMTPFTKC